MKFFYYFASFLLLISCQKNEKDIYNSINDITNPSLDDYRKIQKHLKKGKREYLTLITQSRNPNEKLFAYDKRARNFRLIGKKKDQIPSFTKQIYNTSENDKERCIICYASFNGSFPKGVKRIEKALKKIGYKGHFLSRIGGWPNLNEKGLELAHVLYAFKPCFFKEAKNLGYKKILWLDSSIIPLKNIDEIFEKIEKAGYFGYLSNHKVADYANEHILNYFGIDKKTIENIFTIEGGIIGLDLTTKVGNELLTAWEKSAKEGGFFSSRFDQNAFSIIAYLFNITDWDNPSKRPSNLKDIKEDSIFCVDTTFQDLY